MSQMIGMQVIEINVEIDQARAVLCARTAPLSFGVTIDHWIRRVGNAVADLLLQHRQTVQ